VDFGKETQADTVLTKTEVQSTVDNDTNDGRNESTVETGDTVGSESLLVNRDETVELPGTTLLGRLVVVGETGSGVVERVDEEKGRGTGSSTGSDVTGEPLGVRLGLLEVEHGLCEQAKRAAWSDCDPADMLHVV
jgi:hypothetical protein